MHSSIPGLETSAAFFRGPYKAPFTLEFRPASLIVALIVTLIEPFIRPLVKEPYFNSFKPPNSNPYDPQSKAS